MDSDLSFASGKAPATGALVSSTPSAAFSPVAGRPFFLELTGTGSVTATVTYLCNDGVTYAPNVTATDGGAPIVLDQIAYNGGTRNGVRIELQLDQAGGSVRVEPGVVTGAVNFAFVQ